MLYIARQTGDVALGRAFVERIQARCRRLASLPGTVGRPRPELREDLRSTAFGNHVIFFRYVDDCLEIVNVLEGHRDIDTYFSSQFED